MVSVDTVFRVMYIVGARPQFVKLAPLARAMRGVSEGYIVHTGQHYDREMSSLLFDELRIPAPDVNLGVGSGTPAEQTAAMLRGLEREMEEVKPDCVVVFGDTNSTLAGALAAVKLGVPCIHVEAGLRSWNRAMPEEINRVLTDHASDMLFAPTHTAMENLAREGLAERSILTGDIMVDSLRDNFVLAQEEGDSKEAFFSEEGGSLLTLHRPYNVDDGEHLRAILANLGCLSGEVLFPVHPRTRAVLARHKIAVSKNIRLSPPLGYLDFIRAMGESVRVITDSGGVQKEAYMLGRPCVTLRPETEWVETVEAGWNVLLDPLASDLAEQIVAFAPSGERPPIFGENVAEAMREGILGCIG